MNTLTRVLTLAILTLAIGCASSQKPITQKRRAPTAKLNDVRSSFEQLEQATRFAPGKVGYEGRNSKETLAFREILNGADAKQKFAKLYDSENPASRLYGLAGMYFSDKARFDIEVKEAQNDMSAVDTQRGCIGGRSTVSAQVKGERGNRFDSGVVSLMLAGDSKRLHEAIKSVNAL